MAKALTLNSEQAEIFKNMCSFDVVGLEDHLSTRVAAAETGADIAEAVVVLTELLNQYRTHLSILPRRATIGQYVLHGGNSLSPFSPVTEQVYVRDVGVFEVLELPGRSVVEAMDAAYKTIAETISCFERALWSAERRHYQLQYGDDAKSPFREVGHLREHLSQAQMDQLCEVLTQLEGMGEGIPHTCKRTIDLRPFAIIEAAMILNRMSEIIGIKVARGFDVDVVHMKGTSPWYGGSGAPRNQMKNAVKKTSTPSDRIQAWLDKVS